MKTILITGANRGIGLELTKQYLHDDWKVFACCRDPGKAHELAKLHANFPQSCEIHALEMSDDSQIEKLAKKLAEQPIDVLINNAGVPGSRHGQLTEIDSKEWLNVMHVNAIAPIKMVEAFEDHVFNSDNKIIVMISSILGSVQLNVGDENIIYYCSSKAALNSASRILATRLASQGVTLICMHPGWVKTDMGGPEAEVEVADSVKGIRNVIDNLKIEQAGQFFTYRGDTLPW